MHMMYFTEQPMAAYDAKGRPGLWRHGADLLQLALRSGEGSRLYNEYWKNNPGRGIRRRRDHAERAPQCAILHAGADQHVRRDPGCGDQPGEDRLSGQSVATDGKSGRS